MLEERAFNCFARLLRRRLHLSVFFSSSEVSSVSSGRRLSLVRRGASHLDRIYRQRAGESRGEGRARREQGAKRKHSRDESSLFELSRLNRMRLENALLFALLPLFLETEPRGRSRSHSRALELGGWARGARERGRARARKTQRSAALFVIFFTRGVVFGLRPSRTPPPPAPPPALQSSPAPPSDPPPPTPCSLPWMRSDQIAMRGRSGGAQSWPHGRERPLHSKMGAGGAPIAAVGGSGPAAAPSNSAQLLPHPHATLSPGASESDHTDVRASPDGGRGAGSGKSVAAAMQAQGEFPNLFSFFFSCLFSSPRRDRTNSRPSPPSGPSLRRREPPLSPAVAAVKQRANDWRGSGRL